MYHFIYARRHPSISSSVFNNCYCYCFYTGTPNRTPTSHQNRFVYRWPPLGFLFVVFLLQICCGYPSLPAAVVVVFLYHFNYQFLRSTRFIETGTGSGGCLRVSSLLFSSSDIFICRRRRVDDSKFDSIPNSIRFRRRVDDSEFDSIPNSIRFRIRFNFKFDFILPLIKMLMRSTG